VNRLAALGRERLAAGVLVIGAVVFTATGVIRLLREGGIEVLTLPLALLAADLVIAGALVTRWYAIRPVAQGLAIFGALVHVLVLLRSGPWMIRGWSALLAAAHICALVLFFALSAHEQYDDEDEDDEADDREVAYEPAAGPYAALPAPRRNADILRQPADHPAEVAPELATALMTERQPAAEQPSAEQSTEPAAEPDAELAAEQPETEQTAAEDTEPVGERDSEQPADETTEEPTAHQETDRPAEPADHNGADHNGADHNGADHGPDREGAGERVESGAGRRGAPEGKE
jgi:hypothetical protein